MSDSQGNPPPRPRNTGPLPDRDAPTQANPNPGYYSDGQPLDQPSGYYPPTPPAYPQNQPGYYPPPPAPNPYPYSPYPPGYYQQPQRRSSLVGPVLVGLVIGIVLGGLLIAGFFLLQNDGKANPTALAQASPTAAAISVLPSATANPLAPALAGTDTPVALATDTPASEGNVTNTPETSDNAATDTPSANNGGGDNGGSGANLFKPYPQPTELKAGDTPAPTPAPVISRSLSVSEIADEQQAMLDANRADVSKLDDPSEYNIVASVSLSQRTIDGSAAITYTNNTGVALPILYLRTWPNAPEYGVGDMKIAEVKVNGAAGNFDDAAESGTVLAINLAQSLAAEQTVRLEIKFSDVVPLNGGGYGMYNYANNVMALAAWYPTMAVYDDHGWNLDPPGGQGDQDFSEVSLYNVTLTLPAGAQAATSGSQVSNTQNSDGAATERFVTGPMREFTMVISDKFKLANADANGIKVNSWYLAGDDTYGQNVATYTANAVKIYSQLYGAYPYKEIDAVEVPLGNGAGGIEFPGLVMLDSHLYNANAGSQSTGGFSLGLGEDRVLEFTTVHEIGHQWFYGMVGSNPGRYAFLDEGLVNYTAAIYFEKQYDEATFKQQFDLWCVLPYQVEVQMLGGDDVLYQPTAHWNNSEEGYGAIVYGKGPLFFHVLRQQLGDNTYFKGLQLYWQTYKYGLATPERMIAAFEQASGQDLTALYNRWLLEKHGAEDISKYAVDLGGLGNGLGGRGGNSNPFSPEDTPTPEVH